MLKIGEKVPEILENFERERCKDRKEEPYYFYKKIAEF